MEEARGEAVFLDNSTPVLMIGVKCLCFRAKAAHISGHLPIMSCAISCMCYRVLDFIVHNADPKRASKASSSQLYFFTGQQVWQFLSVKWALLVPDFIVVQQL